MKKIILILCFVLAVSAGQIKKNGLKKRINYIDQADDYIKLNRLQHSTHLKDYATRLDLFKKHYLERVEAINVHLTMVTDNIVHNSERLNPLELLNDLSKHCVTKYRINIPTVTNTKTAMTDCAAQASNQATNLLKYAVGYANSLEDHYKSDFDIKIKICAEKYANTKANYTSCINSVVSNTNQFSIQNKKNFETQIDAAECTAKAYIKRSFDCSYKVQSNVISQIAESNTLINNCLEGKDECIPCEEGHVCQDSINIRADYEKKTILNPFYNRKDHKGCLMLNVL